MFIFITSAFHKHLQVTSILLKLRICVHPISGSVPCFKLCCFNGTCPPPTLSHFNEVSENEILKIIEIPLQNHLFLYPVPTCLLKNCVDILLPSVTKIVNLFLAEGVLPQKLKKAVITLLIKNASFPSKDLKKYRRVSGLYFMSGLVEHVVVKQNLQHINSSNLDNPQQSRTGSRSNPTALVSSDLLAAFDTIDHTTLFNCLKSWFGVRITALKWFTSNTHHYGPQFMNSPETKKIKSNL